MLARLALNAKNIDQYRSCTDSKISIFACYLPICIEIKICAI